MKNPFAFGKDAWDPSHRFETSWLLSPWLLFFVRALFSIYIFATLITDLAWECVNAPDKCAASRDSFSYFTNITYWGLGFYFFFAALHTFTYARSGTPLLDRFPRPLQALHSVFYTTVIIYPFLVTIVFWVILYTPPWFPVVHDGWSNISKHLLNSVFALFEIVFPRTDPPLGIHTFWLIVVLALYLAIAYITAATKGFYTYGFLDPTEKHGLVAAYVAGIAIGTMVVFGIVWGLIWLRRFVTEKKLGKTGKFSAAREKHAEAGDVEMARTEAGGSADSRLLGIHERA